MRTTPTVAIKVLKEVSPLHLQLEVGAKAGIYGLDCNDQWKPKSEDFRHAYITQNMVREPILKTRTDDTEICL
jgi:hypothetical protein